MRAKFAVCVLGLSLLMVSATPQDAIRLESRINQLEQRLYSMETTIRTLEQQSRMAGATQRGASQEDITFLRAQLQALQLRLADDECALAKVDERTLSPAMRDARRKTAVRTDPCRANPDAPIHVPDQQP